MDFFTVVQQRRSCRSYSDKPIQRQDLEKIVDAARFAPTARNEQPWEFIILTEKPLLKRISDLAPNGKFLIEANACIAVFCRDIKYYLEDGCAAATTILNAAYALGLGSCWIAGDKKDYCDEIAKILSVPAGFKLVSLISLGYPKEETPAAEKRKADSLIHWNKF